MLSKSNHLENFLSKKKNITLLYIIVIIGVFILAIGGCAPEKAQKEEHTEKNVTLEEDLKRVLGAMAGVGRVRVAVSFDTGQEVIPLADKSERGETVVTLGSGQNARVAEGKAVMPRVRGVIVVAEGGGEKTVRANIIEAVRALTDAPIHNIAVFAAK